MGLDEWGKLFNSRQLLTLTTFTRLVGEAHGKMLEKGLGREYASAVATYLALSISRLSGEHSTLTRWNPGGEKGSRSTWPSGIANGLGFRGTQSLGRLCR